MPEEIPKPDSLNGMGGIPGQDIPVSFDENEEFEVPINTNSAEEEQMKPSIIELTPDKWEQYKTLRLKGLETEPQAFDASIRKEPEMDEAYWRGKLSNPDFKMFAIDIDGDIVAMAGLEKKPDGRFLLRRVYTMPEMRGKGFSKMLIERVFEEAKASNARSIELDVVEGEPAPIGLYTKLGFQEFDRRPEEKGDGKIHTKIFMRKDL